MFISAHLFLHDVNLTFSVSFWKRNTEKVLHLPPPPKKKKKNALIFIRKDPNETTLSDQQCLTQSQWLSVRM